MRRFWSYFRGALRRVFPECMAQSQSVAFNMFLAFFPVVLLTLGVLTSSQQPTMALEETVLRLRSILPPGSRGLLTDLLGRQTHSRELILLGLWGTLVVGTQVMNGLMDGFRIVYRQPGRVGFWRQQARGFLLLCIALAPFSASVLVTVFGRQVRAWMIQHFGLPGLFNAAWVVVYLGLALVSAMLVLVLLYRTGVRGCSGWNEVVPGAVLATLLWWVVNTGFGFYVRKVPYSLVYGGLAAAIGLMVWMNFSVLVVMVGAAFNAEARGVVAARRETDPKPVTPESEPAVARQPSVADSSSPE